MHAQFLGSRSNRIVVTLQFIFVATGQIEALDAFAARDELHGAADDDCDHHHQEHRHGQVSQVTQASQGNGGGDGQGREGKGKVADGVHVVGQHRDQAVRAILLDLPDGR